MAETAWNWKLNGYPIDANPQKLPAIILTALPDLKFRSAPALVALYSGIVDLALEMAIIERENRKGGQKAQITRFINQIEKSKQRQENKTKTREQILSALYEKILSSEGLGRLHGFGFGNKWGDNLPGNSEYQFVKIIEKQEEKKMKRSELVEVAKELNTVLGLDPQIDSKLPMEELTDQILQAEALIEPGDTITKPTLKMLRTLKRETEAAGKTMKEEVPEEEEKTEEELEFKESKEAVKVAEKIEEKKGKGNTEGKKVEQTSPIPKKGEFGEKTLFLISLLEKGKYSRKEIIEKMTEKFPNSSRNTWGTILTDSKNPKYNKFEKLVIQGEDGILSFRG